MKFDIVVNSGMRPRLFFDKFVFANEAYDDMDRLKHPADIEALKALVRQLIELSQRMM